jgi:ABC-type multidrug transport system fused ATPase/permease subunit
MKSGGGDLRRTLRLFGRFTVGQRRSFLVAAFMLALEAITAVAVPDFISRLTDFLKEGLQPSWLGFTPSVGATVPVIAAGIVTVTAVNSFSASLAEISLANAGRTLGFNLRGALFAHLQRLPLAFHLRRSTGDVLTRLTGDVKAMEDFVEDSVSDIVGSLFVLTATMAYLVNKSPQVALLAVAIVPLLSLISNVFARRIKSASKQERASEGELASTAQEMLTTISLVQVYGRGDVAAGQFARQSRSARDAVLRTARLEAVFSFVVAVVESVGIAIVILVGARLVSSSTLSAGDLIAFIILIQNMFKPIRRIIKQWNRVAGVYASVERVGELLDRKPTVFDTPDARPAPPLRGEIEFRDVSFAYQSSGDGDGEGPGGRLALQSVSFRMAADESVALVGHSGAGKSTIAQLLPRLYDPHAGAILIDGEDIRRYTLDSLRAQIGMVLQETILLRGTVAENIAYGREGATPEEVVRAARHANAHDFITAMPDGYDTVLGERAATLSGGQRQRLAIARAFIRDTPILIMDEPTTGLDAESSSLVAEALQTLARDRATLIVSHDLNLIRSVDRVLVISAGRILEEGSPADLLTSGGLYADLYARQFGDEAAAVAGAPVSAAAGGNGRGEVFPPAVPELPGEPELVGADAWGPERFDTVLTQAVPLPATREEFLALTGWIPAVRRPTPPGEDGLDPLHSVALSRALPGLAEALTPSAMAPRLQRMLADDWELLACSPGKALVEPGVGATLQYRLELRRRGGSGTEDHLVAGRLFPAVEMAAGWLPHVESLIGSLDDRDDMRAFTRPALLVYELNLVLHALPLDPALPGLLPATDPAELVDLLGPRLTSSVPGLTLQGCRAEIVRYAAEGCVLRYEVAWRLQPSRRSLKQVVYGKVYRDDQGRLVGPAVTGLRQHASRPGTSLPFVVPRFQGYLPDLRLALLEAVPGSPQLSALIRGGAGTAPSDGLTCEGAVVACARIAAALHRSSIPVGPSRTLAGEIDGARAAVEALAPLAPAVAGTLRRHLEALRGRALDAPGPPVVAHGDFYPSQVLFDGPTTGLVDFDTVCLGEPALDLGSFTGHLAVAVRKAQDWAAVEPDGAEELGSAFLREYRRLNGNGDPDALLARVDAYRTVTLTRLAVRSWCRLKPQRLQAVLATLDAPRRVRVR